MKYWLSHLPLEVWVDVFCYPWINREELGRIVHRFGNRKYADYLQFYLHDWGKHKLKNWLRIDKDGLNKYVNYVQHRLNFPQAPIPDNIRSLERITISHFDAKTIAFLRQIGPILTNVNLCFHGDPSSDMKDFRIILVNLLPLLDGIRSLSCSLPALLTVKQSFADKLDKIKVLTLFSNEPMDEAAVQAKTDVLLNWLLPGRDDNNGPKCCKTPLSDVHYEKISPAIRQQFLAAKTPRTFALILYIGHRTLQQFVEFHLQNNIGEELHGVKMEHGYLRIIQITRHPANRGTEMQEWIKGIDEAKKPYGRPNRVEIYRPTIGSLDAPENEEEAQQPSTSKKA